jgi:hypothetical protein
MKADRPSTAVVATFPKRADADAAIHSLHDAGYHHTWLGRTQTVDENTFGGAGGTVGAGRERVTSDASAVVRWLRHEGDRTLYDVLLDHGVLEEDARAIDGSVVEGNCVLVVEDAKEPRRVQKILRENGGSVRAVSEAGPPRADALEESRREAARRHPPAPPPTVREELFVRRHLPSSDDPAPY